VEIKGDVLSWMKEDKRKGVLVDWGTFGNRKGFAVIEVADKRALHVLLSKYAEKGIVVTSEETVKASLEELLRSRTAK